MKAEIFVVVLLVFKVLKFFVMAIAMTAITAIILFGIVYLFSPPERRVRLWEGWKRVGHKIGTFNSHVLLWIFYWTIVTPYGIAMRLFADPMRMRKRYTWINRSTRDLKLSDARKQF